MILFATASVTAQNRYTDCLQSFGLVLPLSHYRLLAPALTNLPATLLLLDYSLPGLEGVTSVQALHQLYPNTKIVVLGNRISPEIKVGLFISGARGYANIHSEPSQLMQLVDTVRQGELGIPRALMPSFLERLRTLEPAPDTREQAALLLSVLTQREKEVSLLVGQGHCNKEIARKLGIAERTVKSHLTEIFRKLGITDRLTLALRLNGTLHALTPSRPTLVSVPASSARLSA